MDSSLKASGQRNSCRFEGAPPIAAELRGAFERALVLATVLLAAGIAGLTGCGSSRKTQAADENSTLPVVAVAPVQHQDIERTVSITAEFLPYQNIDVHAKVAGFVREILVDVGDRVHAGQLLAILEIPELRDEVKQAAAAVKLSEEQIQRAQGDLERAESSHRVAHLAYQRLAGVNKSRPNLIAQQDLDDAEGRDREAEAEVAAATAALAAAQQQLAVSRAAQERISAMFAYSRITAPFTGVITVRYADKGSMIQAGTSSQSQAMPVVRLAQEDRLRLVIPVPEAAVPLVLVGSPVQVSVHSLGKTISGKVSRIADQLDLNTRTMHTEVDVMNPDYQLVPGMYAMVSLVLEKKRGALVIPIQALHRSENAVTVLRVNQGNQIEERTVTLGIETPTEAEILSGLGDSDRVVVGGEGRVQPGMTIVPKPMAEMPAAGEH